MQHSVIPAAGKYGLCLNEILFAEYLNELRYSSHIVGKVSYHPCRPALLAWCIFLFLPTFFHIFSLRNISLLIITARKRSLGQGNVFSSVCQEFCSWGRLPQCMLGYHHHTPPGSRHPPRYPPEQAPPREQTLPLRVHAGRSGQQSDGMYPTGMQSCI